MVFPRVLPLREVQSASTRTWTRVTIFKDDNYFTTDTSNNTKGRRTKNLAQSAGGATEYTGYIYQTDKTPHPHPTNVLDMTLNNLKVMF